MKTIISFLLLTCFIQQATAQIQWQHCYGGTLEDECNAIRQTFDSGYILAGYAASNNDEVSGNHGNDDFWVVKITAAGAVEWQQCYGGSGDDIAYDVRQTADSGYIVVGYTTSVDGEVSGNHGFSDMWVIKISSSGALQWQKCLGGSQDDYASSVRQTNDGGYIIAGGTDSDDGDVTGAIGGVDFWVIKLTDTGSITWAMNYGGSQGDAATSVQQTFDGGYIVGGTTESDDFDVTGYHGGDGDFWVMKLSPTGGIQWQECLGGSGYETGGIAVQTNDSGYVVAGLTGSDDGDVTGYDSSVYDGNVYGGDGWVVKLNDTGAIQWNTCVYITGGDYVNAIQQDTDGEYIIAGSGFSYGGHVNALYGKLTNAGGIAWVDTFGGPTGWCDTGVGSPGESSFSAIAPTYGGTGIAAGYTEATNGDVSGNHGCFDYWVVQFGSPATGVANIEKANALVIVPNPANEYLSITASDVINNIVVTNMVGQVVYANSNVGSSVNAHSNTYKLDVHEWMNGMYFVLANGGSTGFTMTGKFVKE